MRGAIYLQYNLKQINNQLILMKVEMRNMHQENSEHRLDVKETSRESTLDKITFDEDLQLFLKALKSIKTHNQDLTLLEPNLHPNPKKENLKNKRNTKQTKGKQCTLGKRKQRER